MQCPGIGPCIFLTESLGTWTNTISSLMYSYQGLLCANSMGWDANQLESTECLNMSTLSIGCFLPNLLSTNLKSFLKPQPCWCLGLCHLWHWTPPYHCNPALLNSETHVLPKHSSSGFYTEVHPYLLSIVKLLGLLLSLRKGEQIALHALTALPLLTAFRFPQPCFTGPCFLTTTTK